MTKMALVALVGSMILIGCRHPSSSQLFPAPDGALAYRVDDFKGGHPTVSDYTEVHALFKTPSGQADKLVLSGEDVDLSSVKMGDDGIGWLCLSGGGTSVYRREVMLTVGDEYKHVLTHLSDQCRH